MRKLFIVCAALALAGLGCSREAVYKAGLKTIDTLAEAEEGNCRIASASGEPLLTPEDASSRWGGEWVTIGLGTIAKSCDLKITRIHDQSNPDYMSLDEDTEKNFQYQRTQYRDISENKTGDTIKAVRGLGDGAYFKGYLYRGEFSPDVLHFHVGRLYARLHMSPNCVVKTDPVTFGKCSEEEYIVLARLVIERAAGGIAAPKKVALSGDCAEVGTRMAKGGMVRTGAETDVLFRPPDMPAAPEGATFCGWRVINESSSSHRPVAEAFYATALPWEAVRDHYEQVFSAQGKEFKRREVREDVIVGTVTTYQSLDDQHHVYVRMNPRDHEYHIRFYENYSKK